MDIGSERADPSFVKELEWALQHLYDPAQLRKSPLAGLLGLAREGDAPLVLRRTLVGAIEALRPDEGVPAQANAWRVYHILAQRYVEQFTQREVAANLALSTRQLGRLEGQALHVLADHLWDHHGVASRLSAPGAAPPAVDGATPSQEQELLWLKASLPNELVDPAEIVRAALKVAQPLAQALAVHVECALPGPLPRVAGQLTTLREALLSLLAAAIRCVPGGSLTVAGDLRAGRVYLQVESRPGAQTGSALPANRLEVLELARRLVELSGGTLELLEGDAHRPLAAQVTFPAVEQATVLVIDDNLDTLQLLSRYLEGTRYRFAGTAEPQKALELAEQLAPQIIVLDVMLPGVDGWELLARLHGHPKTHSVPIIVCTILPHEDLALALGAAALIRKPVTQLAFLAALDRLLQVGN